MSGCYDTVTTRDTGFTADSVEWCPLNIDLLLCGTYQLIKEDEEKRNSRRVGNLQLFSFKPHLATLESLSVCETPGILDVKWCRHPVNDATVFASVTARNSLHLYELDSSGNVVLRCVKQLSHDDTSLGLSLDWSSARQRNKVQIVASDSGGNASLYTLSHNDLTLESHWKAHSYECWITAFNYWDTNIIYSGGDDCTMKGWDIRVGHQKPTFVNKHDMGVCSIQSNPIKDHLIATGGYDESLRLWDDRNMRTALSEVILGGGIWRIKWEPVVGDYALTATMYNGCHMVDATDVSKPRISVEYKGHGSELAYGVDWSRHSPRQFIASCSFYDHSLHIWNINDSNNP